MSGFVSIVGAGPGDPELMTRKAARRLAEADLVLHDALVSPEALALAPRARRLYVGKRAGRKSIRQETIHRLMVRAARRGERVVRLKCGDPFVLGRGGEESLALAAEGVAFEVVPGVSSAVAAPALFGIPVTHRGLASGFVVLSGHSAASYRPILEGIAPGSLTLVVLMGVAARAELASFLVSRGWAPSTPAALCYGASTKEAFGWVGRLGELSEGPSALSSPDGRGEGAAGTLVVGEVVSLSAALGHRPAHRQEVGDVIG